MRRILALVLLTAPALLVTTGCESDCAIYCDRYQECIEDGLDVPECTRECNNWATSDPDNADRAANCASCVQGRTCGSTIENCTDDCIGIPTR